MERDDGELTSGILAWKVLFRHMFGQGSGKGLDKNSGNGLKRVQAGFGQEFRCEVQGV